MKSVLRIEDLKVYYKTEKGLVRAVDGVSIDLCERESLGIVGESGCGKTTMGYALLRILPSNAVLEGSIKLNGLDLSSLDQKQMEKVRGAKISMIFQDPMTSLNPIMKVRDHFIETIQTHKPEISEEEAEQMTANMLRAVGIEPTRMNEYPFQFSGGMRQRVMIALSLVLNPVVVIADEPTTSLDVIVQAQILDLLKSLREKFNMSLILITHDLGVVAELADRVGVMYAGHLVEIGESRDIYYSPKHPYTEALLKSIPNTNIEDKELVYIPGGPPDLADPPKGCRFEPRCPKAMPICSRKEPGVYQVGKTSVKCWLYGEESHVSASKGQ